MKWAQSVSQRAATKLEESRYPRRVIFVDSRELRPDITLLMAGHWARRYGAGFIMSCCCIICPIICPIICCIMLMCCPIICICEATLGSMAGPP